MTSTAGAGKSLVEVLLRHQPTARPPYIPLLGDVVPAVAQIDVELFRHDGRAHARALADVGRAFSVDGLTVGWETDLDAALDSVLRLQSLCPDLALIGCLNNLAAPTVRAWCESGVSLLLVTADIFGSAEVSTATRVASFYDVPMILANNSHDPISISRELGLDGALVPDTTGDFSGIIGGGIAGDLKVSRIPRDRDFFWSLSGEVPVGTSPEALAALGQMLHETSGPS